MIHEIAFLKPEHFFIDKVSSGIPKLVEFDPTLQRNQINRGKTFEKPRIKDIWDFKISRTHTKPCKYSLLAPAKMLFLTGTISIILIHHLYFCLYSSYTLSRNQAVIVEYTHDDRSDLFQIGRSSESPIDFVGKSSNLLI